MLLSECTLTCGKQLSCGNHTCPARDHRGPCPPCLEASYDEVSLGITSLQLLPRILIITMFIELITNYVFRFSASFPSWFVLAHLSLSPNCRVSSYSLWQNHHMHVPLCAPCSFVWSSQTTASMPSIPNDVPSLHLPRRQTLRVRQVPRPKRALRSGEGEGLVRQDLWQIVEVRRSSVRERVSCRWGMREPLRETVR